MNPDKLEERLKNLGGYTVKHNPEVQRLLDLSSDELALMTIHDVSDAITVVGQNLVYLGNVSNIYEARYAQLNKDYEEYLGYYFRELQLTKGTVKEKTADVFEAYPFMEELKEAVSEAHTDMMLLRDHAKHIEGFLNSLKIKHKTLMVEYSNQTRTLD